MDVINQTRKNIDLNYKIGNEQRTFGATLSYYISMKYHEIGLPDDSINLNFRGSAGQSFGVFLQKGISLNLEGDANDYVGKGLSGLQKRYNFTRGPMTHGSKNHRAPGSIGMGTTPGRVLPGKKMAGQLGNKLTTIKKLKVIQLSSEENILIIKGSVPGKPGNLLSITPSN